LAQAVLAKIKLSAKGRKAVADTKRQMTATGGEKDVEAKGHCCRAPKPKPDQGVPVIDPDLAPATSANVDHQIRL
jgi:hypothetical protein